MSASNPVAPAGAASSSAGGYNTPVFWEHLWRMSGIGFVAFAVIAYFVYGYQPGVGAAPDAVVEFFSGHRVRILIAAVISGMAVLNLLWFAAALRATLADAAQDGWGAAATAASAAVGAMFLLIISIVAAIAYSTASYASTVVPALNDFVWASVVLSSFPRAMLIMAVTFGFWRARVISNSGFAAGVAALVLVLLGGTTWLSSGFWAPDGVYSRFVSPIIGLVWVVVVSRVVLARGPATRSGW